MRFCGAALPDVFSGRLCRAALQRSATPLPYGTRRGVAPHGVQGQAPGIVTCLCGRLGTSMNLKPGGRESVEEALQHAMQAQGAW